MPFPLRHLTECRCRRRPTDHRTLSRLGFSNIFAPFFAGTNVPSKKVSSIRNLPASSRNENARSDNNYGNRIASAKQQQFIANLVKAVKGLNWNTLDKYCASKWGANTSQLSPKQASELIDELQAAKAGGKGLAV